MALKAMTMDWGIDQLRPIVTKWISEQHKVKPSVYKKFITDTTIDNLLTRRARNGGFGDIPLRDEGDVLNFGLPQKGDEVDIQPDDRQLAFAITKKDKRFNNMDKVNMYSRMLDRACRRTIEKVAVKPLNLGFDAAYPSFDNTTIFSTTHKRLDGRTTANRPGTDVDLTMASLEAALTASAAMQGEDGTVIDVMLKYLVVSTANMINGARLLGATNYFTGTGDATNTPTGADTGVFNYVAKAGLELVVDPYLTDPDAWFLIADKSENNYELVWNEQITPYGFDDPQTQDSVYSLSFACVAAISSDLFLYGSSGA